MPTGTGTGQPADASAAAPRVDGDATAEAPAAPWAYEGQDGDGGQDPSQDADGDASLEGSYQQRLGERLRAVRRSQGMRLQDVEARSDGRFKAVVVGSYERGDRAVSAHRLAALADFYRLPVTDLLPGEQPSRGGGGRGDAVRLAVDRLRPADEDPATAPLLRLAQHVQRLRGDYNGRVLSLRGDDLRTVAVALGVAPDELDAWLRERGLLAP